MNPRVPHWSNLNCVRIHEMILRVLFGGKTHAFEVSQPRYLENPLAAVRVAKSAAKSSSPCRKYGVGFFFLQGEEKGEVCAVVRINPARSAPGSAGWRGWQVPWAVPARCLPAPLESPSPPAPRNPLFRNSEVSETLRFEGTGRRIPRRCCIPRLSVPASAGRHGRARLLACC